MKRLVNYEITGGSIIGTSHRQLNKNNQDAYFINLDKGLTIVLVADGCGSCHFSETGSELGVRLIAKSISTQAKRWMEINIDFLSQATFWKRVKDDVLAYIRTLSNQMDDSVSQMVYDYFLFTVIGAVISSTEAVFFSLGDGVIIVNEETYKIGPFENNAPPYLTYGLVETTISNQYPDFLDFKIIKKLPSSELESFLIGTDGVNDLINCANKTLPGKTEIVGHISQFWQEDKYFHNKEAINRKLNLINRDIVTIDWEEKMKNPEKGHLLDDTTLIVGRKKRKEV